jgi:hypothetical protein
MTKIALEVYEQRPFLIASWTDKAILFGLRAATNTINYTAIRMVVLKLGWPPIKYISCFLDDK